MTNRWSSSAGLGLLLAWSGLPAAEVGMPAPPVEPAEWINAGAAPSWAGLKGRLILVEKWATW